MSDSARLAEDSDGTRPFVLGVVMLATKFPRLLGDIGNPETFPFETRYRRVSAATVSSGSSISRSDFRRSCTSCMIRWK